MRYKFNSKSLNRAIALSFCLFAASKSFAASGTCLLSGDDVPATVISYNDLSDREELDIGSLENGVLTFLGGVSITRADRILAISGTTEKNLLVYAPGFNIIPYGLIGAKQLTIFAERMSTHGSSLLDSASATFLRSTLVVSHVRLLWDSISVTFLNSKLFVSHVPSLDSASVAFSNSLCIVSPMCAILSENVQDFLVGFPDGFMSVLRPTLGLAADPVEAGDDSSHED